MRRNQSERPKISLPLSDHVTVDLIYRFISNMMIDSLLNNCWHFSSALTGWTVLGPATWNQRFTNCSFCARSSAHFSLQTAKPPHTERRSRLEEEARSVEFSSARRCETCPDPSTRRALRVQRLHRHPSRRGRLPTKKLKRVPRLRGETTLARRRPRRVTCSTPR